MVAKFIAGFSLTGEFLMLIAGGITAVLVFLAIMAMILFLAGVLFDRTTEAMAKRWECTGKPPKHWLVQIIMRRRQGDIDGTI